MNEDLVNDLSCSIDRVASALQDTDVRDSVSVAEAINDGLRHVAEAITPCAAGNQDATGGHVAGLTEAVMGIISGLVRVAEAIEQLAEAVRGRP